MQLLLGIAAVVTEFFDAFKASALYISTAADIVEFFDAFKEDAVSMLTILMGAMIQLMEAVVMMMVAVVVVMKGHLLLVYIGNAIFITKPFEALKEEAVSLLMILVVML